MNDHPTHRADAADATPAPTALEGPVTVAGPPSVLPRAFAWEVVSGAVDLFQVIEGGRRFILRAAPGQVVPVGTLAIEAVTVGDAPAELKPLPPATPSYAGDERAAKAQSAQKLFAANGLLRPREDDGSAAPNTPDDELAALAAGLAAARDARERDRTTRRRERRAEAALRDAARGDDDVAAVFGSIANANASTAPRPTSTTDPHGHAAALSHVLTALGLGDPRILESPEAALDTSLSALAGLCGLRTRTIALEPGWRDHTVDPLIGRRVRDARAIALLPRQGRVVAIDPITGHATPVDDDIEAELELQALSLTRRWPTGTTSLLGLGRFAIAGGHSIVAALLVCVLLQGALAAVLPLATGYIVDRVIPTQNVPLLAQLAAGLALVALVQFALSVSQSQLTLRLDGRTSYALQTAIWDRIVNLPAGFFRGYSAGDLSERVAGLEALRGVVVNVVLGALLSLVLATFSTAVLIFYDVRLALVAIALTLVLAILVISVSLFRRPHLEHAIMEKGAASALTLQFLEGIAKLRVAAAEERALGRWARVYARERSAMARARRVGDVGEALLGGYPILAMAAVFGAIAALSETDLSPGTFIGFIAAFGTLQTAATGAVTALLSYTEARPQFERALPLITTPLEETGTKIHPGPLGGRVEFAGLTFRYDPDGPMVLEDINLAIEPGEHIAIVGASGSGKSTLLRLLLGFETPERGAVFFDRHNLAGLKISAVRRQIGVVLQDGRVFSGTIADNIRGASTVSDEAIRDAAIAAGLEEDLRAFPMGLFTPLTEGGPTLSGGQRQRVLIARALAMQPKILVLDEATSALDNRNQAKVSAALDALNATRIAVAHRLSTVINADRIAVLERGRLVEVGTYDTLMAKNGAFSALARRQSAERSTDTR